MDTPELVAREHIRHLIASYTQAGDGFRLDDLAALFTEDGSLQVDGREPAQGRAAIVAMLGSSGERTLPGGVAPGAFYVRHFIANVLITDVTSNSARGTCYFAVLTPTGLDHWGRYRDEYVHTDGAWLFKTRRVRVDSRVGRVSYLDD